MSLRSIRIWLIGFLAVWGAWAVWFYHRQNAGGHLGGPISPPKMLWLAYTLFAWFIVPFFLWRDARLDPPVRRIFGVFWVVMFARGAIEMVLLYAVVHWNPLYGISEDILCLLMILILRRQTNPTDATNRRALRYSGSLLVSLVAEIAFAGMFLQMKVHQQAIYFASTESQWRFVNLVTTVVIAFVYPDLVATLVGLFIPGVARETPRPLRWARIAAASLVVVGVLAGLGLWTWGVRP